jgi:hypothetical protein
MGCFDKTCCLTNTSISAGEKCLIITLNQVANIDLHNAISRVHSQMIRKDKELSKYEMEAIKGGVLNKAYFLPIRDVFHGTYDDYGSIDEYERIPEDYEDYRIGAQMFHVWAVEELFNGKIDKLLKEPIKFVYDLYCKLYFLRKTPFGLEISGQQHKDIKEMEFMIKVNEMASKYLKSKIEEHKKWKDD